MKCLRTSVTRRYPTPYDIVDSICESRNLLYRKADLTMCPDARTRSKRPTERLFAKSKSPRHIVSGIRSGFFYFPFFMFICVLFHLCQWSFFFSVAFSLGAATYLLNLLVVRVCFGCDCAVFIASYFHFFPVPRPRLPLLHSFCFCILYLK